MSFVMEATEAEQLRARESWGAEAFLSSLVDPTRALARPPISKFKVGAVGMGSSGRVFRGVNLEFPGLPLSQSVHAEQFLVANMFQNGETCLRLLAVSAAPCGHCRQFLQELRGASGVQILIVTHSDSDESQLLEKFLPHRFGPQDLLHQDFPLLLEPQDNLLRLGVCNGHVPHRFFPAPEQEQVDAAAELQLQGMLQQLKSLALEAANRSYSPYSNCPSGMAILTKDGKVFSGSYCESAAYNPSLPPLQAALVAFVANGGGDYDDIACALLVEKDGAPVQQVDCAKMVLSRISPKCPLYLYYAVSAKSAA